MPRPAHLWQKYNWHRDLTPLLWSTGTAIYHRGKERDRPDWAGDLRRGYRARRQGQGWEMMTNPCCDSSVLLWAVSTLCVLLWVLSTELWVNRARIANLPDPLLSPGSQTDWLHAWAPKVTCSNLFQLQQWILEPCTHILVPKRTS